MSTSLIQQQVEAILRSFEGLPEEEQNKLASLFVETAKRAQEILQADDAVHRLAEFIAMLVVPGRTPHKWNPFGSGGGGIGGLDLGDVTRKIEDALRWLRDILSRVDEVKALIKSPAEFAKSLLEKLASAFADLADDIAENVVKGVTLFVGAVSPPLIKPAPTATAANKWDPWSGGLEPLLIAGGKLAGGIGKKLVETLPVPKTDGQPGHDGAGAMWGAFATASKTVLEAANGLIHYESLFEKPQQYLEIARQLEKITKTVSDPDHPGRTQEVATRPYGERCTKVIESLEQLLGDPSPTRRFVEYVLECLKELVKDGSTGDFGSLGKLAFFPISALYGLLHELQNGALFSEKKYDQNDARVRLSNFLPMLPMILKPGNLRVWLDDDTDKERKRFKEQLVIYFDAYYRGIGELPGVDGLRGFTDAKNSVEHLAGFLTTLLSCCVDFVFRPDHFPVKGAYYKYVMHAPEPAKRGKPKKLINWPQFDDIGADLANFLSRQVQYGLESVSGLLLRGFWQYTTNNTSIVEALAKIIGTVVGGIVEGVCLDLFWTLQVHRCYATDYVPEDYGLLVHSWPKPSTRTQRDSPHQEYRVYLRPWASEDNLTAWTDLVTTSKAIMGVLEDYIAFRDTVLRYRLVCYQCAEWGDLSEKKEEAGAKLKNRQLILQLRSPLRPVIRPIPVMWARFRGVEYVMNPIGETQDMAGKYQCRSEVLPEGKDPGPGEIIEFSSSFGRRLVETYDRLCKNWNNQNWPVWRNARPGKAAGQARRTKQRKLQG